MPKASNCKRVQQNIIFGCQYAQWSEVKKVTSQFPKMYQGFPNNVTHKSSLKMLSRSFKQFFMMTNILATTINKIELYANKYWIFPSTFIFIQLRRKKINELNWNTYDTRAKISMNHFHKEYYQNSNTFSQALRHGYLSIIVPQ